MGTIDYTNICFVIMPFNKKSVGDREVDFDDIYARIFEPAIEATSLPEGGRLKPRRTDQDFFSAEISVEMFHYLEYSRFALADISGLNANVFYELGARHRARQTGTAIFRQTGAPLPFDINHVKAFPYDYEPEASAAQSRELITRVLRESLEQNRLDSPVQLALLVQQQDQQQIEGLLRDADNAIGNQDAATAILKYGEAIKVSPANPLLRLKIGLLLKDQGNWHDALAHLTAAVSYSPTYAEAYREKGVVENKLHDPAAPSAGAADGESSLRRAIELDPQDFDALASLGGVLKRKGRYVEALEMYRRATEVSNGHPYPLLNELKLQARAEGRLQIDDRHRFQLGRAERSLRAQVANNPPYNAPWSFFDLAETRLYSGDATGFLSYLDEGLLTCTAAWQPKTFRDSLQLLVDGHVGLPGLEGGMKKLEHAIRTLGASDA